MRRLIGCAVIALLAFCAQAHGGPILTGSDTFDAGTGLYTYSYTLDNTAGSLPIYTFDVEVNPFGPDRSFTVDNPVLPSGWFAYGSIGMDTSGNHVTFAEFSVFDPTVGAPAVGTPVAVGSTLSGFSFTSTFAPFTADYEIAGGQTPTTGTVVGPHDPTADFGPPPSPEPSSLLLAGVGLVGVIAWGAARSSARRRGSQGAP